MQRLRKYILSTGGNVVNYLNTDIPYILFQKALNSKIHVDKSMLIDKISAFIGTNTQYVCITRPRRFGKSVNAHMLGAYYTKDLDSHKLFEKLEVSNTEDYEKHQNNHNVIFIDLSKMPFGCKTYHDYINSIYRNLEDDIREKYMLDPDKKYDDISIMLKDTKDSFIFILDEWDSVFYKNFMTKQDTNEYLFFIKNLLKDQPYVELAYMTGVLPIAKYSSGSELNMFDEYNLMNDTIFAPYFGFYEDEVKDLCNKYPTLTYKELKYWYDGYYSWDGKSVFNPRSVVKALTRGVCLNYWTETGPMNEIADCIEHNTDVVREDIVTMVADIPVEVDLQGYSAVELQLDTRDEILSAMVVFGFLSYYNGYLKIPNHELMEKFQRVLSRNSMKDIKEIVDRSREVLEATLTGNSEKLAEILEQVHDKEIPFLQYNDENSLSCVITLCYLYARKDYYIEREAKSGKGYCDYLLLPKKYGKKAIILELKVDDTCENALAQIKDKNYIQKAKEHTNEVVLVGISYDKTQKKHQCIIETSY